MQTLPKPFRSDYICVWGGGGGVTLLLLFWLLYLSNFLAPCSIELLLLYCKMYWVFHINDKPEGKFLYTETIKLSTINRVLSACICMQKDHLHTVRVLQLLSEFSGLWK